MTELVLFSIFQHIVMLLWSQLYNSGPLSLLSSMLFPAAAAFREKKLNTLNTLNTYSPDPQVRRAVLAAI